MDLSTIEQLKGKQEQGLEYQALALQQCQIFETFSDVEPTLDLLVLAAPIHMGGNTPIDFLVAGSSIRHRTVFLGPELELPGQLPEHDVLLVAAPGDSGENRKYLEFIKEFVDDADLPVLNNPEAIGRLERDELARIIGDTPGVKLPDVARVSRAQLQLFASLGKWEAAEFTALGTPFLIRPVGSHAGRNLEKLQAWTDIPAYLQRCQDEQFFISSFLDYRSRDNNFRKYRIIFVGGEPFACHMAISDQWKIWYMNADMHLSEAKRSEEQDFMVNFDETFRRRHEHALCEVANRIGLDYFGIDCAESAEGELVIFEADNALIVHDMDPPEIFPYKALQMQKIFAAFTELVQISAQRSAPVRTLSYDQDGASSRTS